MMQSRFPGFTRAVLTFLLGSTLVATPAIAQREAKVYAVTTWNAGCPGDARSWWDNMADAWYDEITRVGFEVLGQCVLGHCGDAYSRDGRRINGEVINSKFADAGVVSWGNDGPYIDDADAALVAWHGSESGSNYRGSMRVDEPGSGNCTLARSEMRLGNTDLEFLHISSCNSMDDNQWGDWWRAFAGAHQVDGFHGIMWIGESMVDDYEDFAADAFSGSIADAWLDNMYVKDVSGSFDQCPVAYAVGKNYGDVWLRMTYEQYDNVWSTKPTVGYWRAVYFSGCNPKNGGPL